MKIEQKILLALLIIHRSKPNANSHGIVKVLTWKFKMMDFLEIMEKVKSENLVNYYYEKGIGYFTLNGDGLKLIEEQGQNLISVLLQNFPEEKEYIESLI